MTTVPTAAARVREIESIPIESIPIEVDSEVWSIECTVDELHLDLCRAQEEIVKKGDPFNVNGKPYQHIEKFHVRKYYRQARDLMKWIPIARPVPKFVISTGDLSPKVIEELEARIDNPPTFTYILKQAVGRLFENIDFEYYHQSVAKSLKVRLEE